MDFSFSFVNSKANQSIVVGEDEYQLLPLVGVWTVSQS